MGPRSSPPSGPVQADVPRGTVVFQRGVGANVFDVDGNRYVDLAAGFGSLLLGHSPVAVLRGLELQSARLLQALGDVHPSDAKIGLLERLARLHPAPGARVILGQSGADAVTGAVKSAVLATGRSGLVAFRGAYHGLSYAPLAACGLRASYREPFAAQLAACDFVDYPVDPAGAARSLSALRECLNRRPIAGVLVEPVLGRGGCVVPPAGFLREVAQITRASGALLIADEIWTGLGRTGAMLRSVEEGLVPDLICLGKGLGGGIPISAVVGTSEVMGAWQCDAEVVHTSTFGGAPLACTAALATLDAIGREDLANRSRAAGERWRQMLVSELPSDVTVRGVGMMIGIDLGAGAGAASRLARGLLERGYLTSTGGGAREALVLSPPLNTPDELLFGFVPHLVQSLKEL
jgi:4-aminobutyrate aminotransferase/(S)-3-amino-2-methylpropionate transaminase